MPELAARPRTTERVLAGLTALALAVSAYVHADLGDPPYAAAGQVTLSGLFVAQAVVAAAVVVWLLVRPGAASALGALVVGAASLAALVLSVYVRLPSVGPFPVLYEPLWYADKVVAAVAAGVATVLAAALLAGRRRPPVR
jgi:hypothetical protein